jgi:2-polyprenyl-6-methoxyphenol hydroxylase-like FAD-dependent oxidoreductase
MLSRMPGRSGRRAEIVGAGIAGLTAATALARSGWDVRVHETSDDLRIHGAGIHLWDNGLLVLEEIGALEGTVEGSDPIERWTYQDQRGRYLLNETFEGGTRLYVPSRSTLNNALVEAARREGAEIVTGSTAVSADPDGRVVFEDGRTVEADLVVAADGHRSRLRESLGLTKKFITLRDTSTRLLVPKEAYDSGNNVNQYSSGHRRILIAGCSRRYTYFALVARVKDEQGGRVPVDTETWLESFPRHAEAVKLIGEVSRRPGTTRRDGFSYVVAKSWSAGRVALVGDSAHAQPPHLGQGANMSMQNALGLAVLLEGANDVPAALRRWEELERPLSDHVQRWARAFGTVSEHWPEPLHDVRSLVLRAMNRSAWLGKQLSRGAASVPRGTERVAERRRDLARPAVGTP